MEAGKVILGCSKERIRSLNPQVAASVYTQKNVVGASENMIRDHAIAAIQAGKPCIVGTGWLTHYPLAWGYVGTKKMVDGRERDRVGEYFLVNQGWGRNLPEWVPARTWFAGSVVPGYRVQTQHERSRYHGPVYFRDLDGRWYSVPRNGKTMTFRIAGGKIRWWHDGNYERSRFNSSATRVEVSIPDTHPRGLIILQALR